MSVAAQLAYVPHGVVLVVEDDPHVGSYLGKWAVAEGWDARLAATVRAGLDALSGALDCAIMDLGLPDGSGFEVVDAAREQHPDLPILILTGALDEDSVNRAQRVGVAYVCKPACRETIRHFLARCWTDKRHRLSTVVNDFVATHGLTAAHARLLEAAITESATRDVLSQALGVKPNTVKTQVTEILARVGRAGALEEVVAPLRKRVLRKA
jgi:DNA-binding response OmpR family regulator